MGTLNLGKLEGVARTLAGLCIGCTVAIYPAGSVNADGSLIGTPALSTIYSDQDGDTAITNPMTVSSSGAFSCYVAPGMYDLRFTGTGITSRGVQNVQVLYGKVAYRIPFDTGVPIAFDSTPGGSALPMGAYDAAGTATAISWGTGHGLHFDVSAIPPGGTVKFYAAGKILSGTDPSGLVWLYDVEAAAVVGASRVTLTTTAQEVISGDIRAALTAGTRHYRLWGSIGGSGTCVVISAGLLVEKPA